jgi:hypothetical protein
LSHTRRRAENKNGRRKKIIPCIVNRKIAEQEYLWSVQQAAEQSSINSIELEDTMKNRAFRAGTQTSAVDNRATNKSLAGDPQKSPY